MRGFYFDGLNAYGRKTAIIVACLIIFIAIVFSITFFITSKTANADFYKISGDSVASIKAVVGKRSMNSVSSDVGDRVVKKIYGYNNVKDVKGDILQYINYLCKNEKFKAISAYDLTQPKGNVQLVRESIDDDKIIVMTIEYSLSNYFIIIEKSDRN